MKIDKNSFRLAVIGLLVLLNITTLYKNNYNCKIKQPLTKQELEFIKKDIIKTKQWTQTQKNYMSLEAMTKMGT